MPEIPSDLSGVLGLTWAWFISALANCIRSGRALNPDLVHVHGDGQLPALLLASIAPSIFRVPTVLTLHCSRLSVYQPMSTWDRVQHPVVAQFERLAIRRSALVTTLTESTQRMIARSSGASAPELLILPDVVNVSEFASNATPERADQLRRQWQLEPQRPVVMFVGRIAYEKGWRHLLPLAAALAIHNPHIVIVGDGPERHLLEAEIARSPYRASFRITGFVANPDVAVALSLASVVVMPSLHEEFGGTSIESFALRKPVVAFAVGGLRTVIGELFPDLLVPPGDVAAMARVVARVLQEGMGLSSRLDAAAEQVRDRFEPDLVFPRLLAKYWELCEAASHDKHGFHQNEQS
jgi:2-deoxystreptamine N-acetyl-D-glucosaminyltransferase/2-deoxystreptamine glucosyltransferase